MAAARKHRYPPIEDYALIGDCHSVALISRSGSIDWCCLPRYDDGSVFGRLIDWEKGGFCAIGTTDDRATSSRRYLPDTLVLETTIEAGGGEARVFDCMTMRRGGRTEPFHQILRVVEGVRGQVELEAEICPRFDYAEVRPWIRQLGVHYYAAIGGDDALVFWSDGDIEPAHDHDLAVPISVREGERWHLSIQAVPPHLLDEAPPPPPDAAELDKRLDQTIQWWHRWYARGTMGDPYGPAVNRSAMALKAMTHAPTGAIVAAPTTSLPEVTKGTQNWDYRYSWVRDSSFSVRSLAELGHEAEANGFRRFVERSSAGHAEDLQIMFGVGGERRLDEFELTGLEGYRGATPVRVGNAAAKQLQLDVFGELLDLSWRWHERGNSPDDDYWRFLVDLCEMVVNRWQEPDRGFWEIRGRPRHFVLSKAMCWVALDRGLRLAKESSRAGPVRRWTRARDEIRRAVESRGYDPRRGVFVRDFGSKAMDASLLLLPSIEFVEYEDERMVRTVDRIRDQLAYDGLLRRYRSTGELKDEGAFVPGSFWLAECLARQGRIDEAREAFDAAVATGNDLGLFAEEFDPRRRTMLGNFPQALTHLSHITAAVALARLE